MTRRVTQWYVEPLNDYSNAKIAEALAETHLSNSLEEVRDGSNRPHKVFAVDYLFVDRLQSTQTDTELRFKVFNRTSTHGKVRTPSPFGKKRSAKVKRGVRRSAKSNAQ